MRAKLSRTEPGIARFLQSLFFFLVVSPPLPERFFTRLLFEKAARPPDCRRRERFEDDVVVVLVNDGSRPFVDLKILSQPAWDHDLPLGRKGNCISACWIH